MTISSEGHASNATKDRPRRLNANSSLASLSTAQRERARRLYAENIVWNACDSTPEEHADQEYVAKIKKSEVTAVNHTVAYTVTFKQAVKAIATWSKLYEDNPDVGFIARNYADIARAKAEGRTAIFMGFQDITALEEDIDLLDTFHQLGIRFVQPTYQDRNVSGDGCGERIQSGLSKFGVRLIEKLNKLRIVVDLSHVGVGSTLEAIEISKQPVMVTHSGSKTIVDTARNKTDEEIKALAKRGGVIGIAGKSGFLRRDGLQVGSNVDDFIDSIDYVRDLVGVEHVCIGTDIGDERGYNFERISRVHKKHPEIAIIGDDLLLDRMHTDEVGPGSLYPITEGLVSRGYSDEDIGLILGGNVNRVLRQIWTE